MAEQERITDEAIDNIVAFIEKAELMAATMGTKVSVAARWMMKSAQMMGDVGANPLQHMNPASKRKM
jgi:hypothetical protein